MSGLGVVGLSDPCGVGLSKYENVCGANRYSVGWCGSECHSVQLGVGAIVKAPKLLCPRILSVSGRELVNCFLITAANSFPVLKENKGQLSYGLMTIMPKRLANHI